MRHAVTYALIASLTLAGCARVADSRFNPLNWFGASAEAAVPRNPDGSIRPLVPAGGVQVIDNRVLIARVDELEVARTPAGAIVRATGTASAQGRFNAQLVPVRADAGTLTLAFRVERAAETDVGSEASRRVTVARFLSAEELLGVRRIAVQGRSNARAVNR